MSRIDVLRPFVEKNLATLTGSGAVGPDASGEYVFPHGSAEISVRLLDHPFPMLQLSAVLVKKPKKQIRLLEALNSLNASEHAIRIFKYEDLIVGAWEVPADTLDERQFRDICVRFAESADRLDTQLAKRFGGKTARADQDDEEEAVDA
jgi:hypothetical protein